MDIDNQDNELDLSFFADEDEDQTSDSQDSKIQVEKDEYEALKAKAAAQQAQAEAIAKPQPQQTQSETAALDEYFDKRFEQKVPQLNDIQVQQAAIMMAKAQHPELASDEDIIAPFVARAARDAQAKGEQADYLTLINRGVEAYKKLTGKAATSNANQQNALKYGLMNPDVRGVQQPKAKQVDFTNMESEKFEQYRQKIRNAHAEGKSVRL